MDTFDRIVCGVDGSGEALDGLRQARRLVSPGGRISALVVADLGEAAQAGWSAAPVSSELLRAAERARDEAVRVLRGPADAEVQIVYGPPASTLLAALEEQEATLAVVGSHGRSRTAGIVLGSVATTLLHEAPCPVLLARQPVDSTLFPYSIVAGVDGSAESLAAAAVAEELAERFHAALCFVAATGGKPVDVDGLVRLTAREPAYAGGPAGDRATARVPRLEWSELSPLDALVRASAHADLLVVGSRGLHGLASLGSVGERVAHRARCSVLVVRG